MMQMMILVVFIMLIGSFSSLVRILRLAGCGQGRGVAKVKLPLAPQNHRFYNRLDGLINLLEAENQHFYAIFIVFGANGIGYFPG